jgi:glycosyltransferase involved in cell wall biosynthesis
MRRTSSAIRERLPAGATKPAVARNSALVAIAKNEQRSIAEWIAYHRCIGFDQIIVYDNGSTDGTASIINHISRLDPAVIYKYWPDRIGQAPQLTAYAAALQAHDAKWFAFLDIDEFLVLRGHDNVNDYLGEMKDKVGAIALNWLIFGSSGQIEPGVGLVMDRFVKCASRRHGKNLFCKTIVRSAAVAKISVHTATLNWGYYADSTGRRTTMMSDAKTSAVCHDGAQLNHYLLKSWKEFTEKRERGNAARAPGAKDKFSHRGNSLRRPNKRSRDRNDEYWIKHDLNSSKNRAILCWKKLVNQKLAEWGFLSQSINRSKVG